MCQFFVIYVRWGRSMDSKPFYHRWSVNVFIFLCLFVFTPPICRAQDLDTKMKLMEPRPDEIARIKEQKSDSSNSDSVESSNDSPLILNIQAFSCPDALLVCSGRFGRGCYSPPNNCDNGLICPSGGFACAGPYGRPHCYFPSSGNSCHGGLSCNGDQQPCLPPATRTPHCIFSGQTCR
jgi:hypothetical protein